MHVSLQIVLSLFVAVILGWHLLASTIDQIIIADNLEMDEELKKIKQLKAREETTMRTTLPWRLRIFGWTVKYVHILALVFFR